MNDLSTIDTLVEFGMSTALASQMIRTMNQTMAECRVAGVNTGVNMDVLPSEPSQYYAVIDNKQAGPLTVDELSQLITRGLVTGDTLLWRPGMSGWAQAKNVPEAYKYILLK